MKLKHKFQKTPSGENYAALRRMESQLQDIMRKSKERHWGAMLETINEKTSQHEVAKKVACVAGKTRKQDLHANPKGKAQELIQQWAEASSIANLPIQVRRAVRKRIKSKSHRLEKALKQAGLSDNKPITQVEFERAMKKGKSTAPGEDGITYKVIKFLSTVDGNPILRLYNMIWEGGRIPRAWKRGIIIPINKPGKPGEFRPISLTSCLSKYFERIVLNRLMFEIKHKLSHNMYGFIAGKSTQHCIHRVKTNVSRGYTAFIDLKGAFDRANHQVIMGELATLTRGTLLRIVDDYLSNRSSSVLFQGEESEWRDMELGMPQGGVLSPTLFNILVNVIASKSMKGITTTVYADDIVLQGLKREDVVRGLRTFSDICNSIGLVIAPQKCKIMCRSHRGQEKFKIQGTLVDFVKSFKYLGIIISVTETRSGDINRIVCATNGRLQLLRTIAHSDFGGSVIALRRLYVSMIRSVIDYSASSLLPLLPGDIRKLESIQLRAARAILRAPMCTNQHLLRTELGLIPIEQRLTEVAATQLMRTLTSEGDSTLTHLSEHVFSKHKRKWLRGVKTLVGKSIMDKYLQATGQYRVREVPPWDFPKVSISWSKGTDKKSNRLPEEMRQEYLQRVEDSGGGIIVYSDGSVLQDGRCGAGFCGYIGGWEVFGDSIRVSNDCSTTVTEICGMLAAIKYGEKYSQDMTVVCDSSAALHSLTTKKPMAQEYITKILSIISRMNQKGLSVQFVWAPSHIGILGNERADKLASIGAKKDRIDYIAAPPISKLKMSVGAEVAEKYMIQREATESVTVQRYMGKYEESAPPSYRSLGLDTRKQQIVYSRIRMGYPYLWQVVKRNRPETDTSCRVCKDRDKHTLAHYITECPMLSEVRDRCPAGIEMEQFILDPDILCDILKDYSGFCSVR